MAKKVCCILASSCWPNNIHFRSFFEKKLRELIEYGYTHFITYYGAASHLNIFNMLRQIEKELQIDIHLEMIFIETSGKYNKFPPFSDKEYNDLLALCNKTKIISDENEDFALENVCHALLKDSDYLLYYEDVHTVNWVTSRIVDSFVAAQTKTEFIMRYNFARYVKVVE